MKKQFERIYIELTNKCNFNCPFCAKSNRAKLEMDIDFFNQVVKGAKEFTNEICLHVLGEPLIYKDLAKAFEIVKEQQLKINLVSNGFFASENKNLIIDNKDSFFKICFSLHSYQFREGEIAEKINEILQTSQELANSGIIVELRLMFAKNKATKIFNKKILQQITDFFKVLAIEESGSTKLCEKCFLVFKKEFEWPEKEISQDELTLNENKESTDKNIRAGKKVYCLGTKSHIAILASGVVVPCCLDASGQINLGNLHNESLAQILKSERFMKINQEFSCNCTTELLCKNCSYNKKF